MQRQYLYVPYEEKSEVEARGACWDGYTKRWYLTPEHDWLLFKRWLTPNGGDEPDEERYLIESEHAYIACAETHCQHCAREIEVIALYCIEGLLDGEPLDDFSVMHITAVDDALRVQLARWPFFRQNRSLFRNYCSHCKAPQEDMDLHCEPDGAFFHMDPVSRQSMTLVRLKGRVRLNGAETFEI